MAMSKKALNEKVRAKYLDMVSKFLTDKDEEVLRVASNEICIPCVDENGDDNYIVLTFKVPTGDRDGTPYDGYAMADEYARKTAEKAQKAEEARIAKEKKIAKDKADREAKAKAKAEHKAGKA